MVTKQQRLKIQKQLETHWHSLLDIRDQLEGSPCDNDLVTRLTKLCKELDNITEEVI